MNLSNIILTIQWIDWELVNTGTRSCIVFTWVVWCSGIRGILSAIERKGENPSMQKFNSSINSQFALE